MLSIACHLECADQHQISVPEAAAEVLSSRVKVKLTITFAAAAAAAVCRLSRLTVASDELLLLLLIFTSASHCFLSPSLSFSCCRLRRRSRVDLERITHLLTVGHTLPLSEEAAEEVTNWRWWL